MRLDPHNHTMYSNIRLLDCINKPKALVNRAIELNMAGIAITDHESLGCHIEMNQYQFEIQKKNPNFKILLGNEIYLCENRDTHQKFYHFILIAKDKIGHNILRKLSSRAWMNSFWSGPMERVVTTYQDLVEMVASNPGHLIATTACIGGQLSSDVLNMIKAERAGNNDEVNKWHDDIVYFIMFCQKLFGTDFYIECAPACSREQIMVNQRLMSIAQCFDIKMVVGSDTHYLRKEDRYVHKAYLNSKNGEREVDDFYEYCYLQSDDEVIEHLKASNFDELFIRQMFENSMEIYNKVENYSLLHKQQIPHVDVKDYPKRILDEMSNYPNLKHMFASDDKVERYWVNQCWEALINKFNDTPFNHSEYLAELEEEADTKRIIGEKLETNMFSYPVTLQHYIDLIWEYSTIGAGRGSSCSGLNHYLLGITQLDPIEWKFPWFRYMNRERTELGDIDIDIAPSKRPIILQRIREERGQKFNSDIDDLSRKNLGCTLIATYGTEGTKSAILTACRGYRSEEYPDGIDVDTAQYLASFIPQERGFLWPIEDVYYGNEKENRKPITMFVNEINQYPGLIDIIISITGLINKRSSHASGVIFFDEDPYEFGCFMRTPKGEIITQYDLHMCEAAGMTKFDLLVTEVQDKIMQCIELLQNDGEIEDNLTLREIYNKYFHPNVLPLDDKATWEAIQNVKVLDLFQFDSDVGRQGAKKVKPTTIQELSDTNGLIRLMASEKGAELPLDKYVRYKNNIKLWYNEMDKYGLTKEEQKVVEPYFLESYGVPPSQEQLMRMLMDDKICHFTLAESNAARKIVGKKQLSKIPELHEKVLIQAASPALGRYVWDCGIGPQMGYAFSLIHSMAYSIIGFQTAYLATHWNPIYWNTACLIINSASIEEDDDEDIEKKEKSTDYAKIAKAIGDIISHGIKVSLVDINRSSYGFIPDADNNEILFGMKALNGVGGPIVDIIIKNRPYQNIFDFMRKCGLTKTAMFSLIKAGAFDKTDSDWARNICPSEPRMGIMAAFVMYACEPKKKLTLQNFRSLINRNLIPAELDFEKSVFNFNAYLKKNCKQGLYYTFDNVCANFYNECFSMDDVEIINGTEVILQKTWDKIYKSIMENAKTWLKNNQDKVLNELNTSLFAECWHKYASGTVSAWEMEAMCFYYHQHELDGIDTIKYGISDFNKLNSTPPVDYFFKRNGKEIPIFQTFKIMGTVIGKNNTKASISLLTTSGVVNVKFTKEYYAMYNRQLSEVQDDGTKKVAEKGWFIRGTKLLITGFRRDDTFVAKSYKHTPTHQLYKIIDINGKEMTLEHERISE